MATDKSATQQRIDNAIYGTPKIKPDEQRKYLGTFRERVCLTISVDELHQKNWAPAVTKELQRGIGNQVFLNGNLPHEELQAYIRAVTAINANFTLKTEPEFQITPESLAVVVAAKTAVYQSPVDVKKRYPDLIATTDDPVPTAKKKSFWEKLFRKKEE